MLPELLKVPALGITVYTYGVMLALGCSAGLYVTVRLAENDHVSRANIYLLAFFVLPSSLLGTKLFAIAHLWQGSFRGRGFPSAVAILEAPGFYLGGFLTGLATSVLFTRAWKLPWLTIADAAAPGLALGNVLGRVGCFAAGCCWGRPTTSWLGVRFNERLHHMSGVPSTVALIPTQLIEACANVGIFVLLIRLWKTRIFRGQIALSYMILYSVERFVVEFWRGDPRGRIMNFSTSQFLCLHIFAVAVVLYWWLRGRGADPSEDIVDEPADSAAQRMP